MAGSRYGLIPCLGVSTNSMFSRRSTKLCSILRQTRCNDIAYRRAVLPVCAWMMCSSRAWSYSGLGDERAVFHYNGHGVPRPTPRQEIWVFNQVSVIQVKEM